MLSTDDVSTLGMISVVLIVAYLMRPRRRPPPEYWLWLAEQRGRRDENDGGPDA